MMNIIKDLHICGTCKNIFNYLKLFLEHKSTCASPESHAVSPNGFQDVCVDSELITNHCILDLTDLNNGALPIILQYDKQEVTDRSSDVLEECYSQESEYDNLNLTLASEIIISDNNNENDGTCFLVNHLSEAVTTLQNENEANEMVNYDPKRLLFTIEQSREVKDLVIQSIEEVVSSKDKKNACGVCSFVAIRQQDLTRHMRRHSGERPYECNICDKKFARQDKLMTHKRIHVGDKRYKCQLCDYASTDGGALSQHLRVHSDERPHKCQICSYKAKSASHLTVHLRKHTGDCPFVCKLDLCRRAFKTSTDLKRHMKIHKQNIGAPKYSCEGVSKKRHGRGRPRQGVGERVHECPHCGASFVRPDSLHSHLRQHS